MATKAANKLPHGGKRPGSGRKKGVPNKFNADIKAALLEAANQADKDGMVGYLLKVAKSDARTFCGLLGRAMPTQLAQDPDAPLFPGTIQVKLVNPDD